MRWDVRQIWRTSILLQTQVTISYCKDAHLIEILHKNHWIQIVPRNLIPTSWWGRFGHFQSPLFPFPCLESLEVRKFGLYPGSALSRKHLEVQTIETHTFYRKFLFIDKPGPEHSLGDDLLKARLASNTRWQCIILTNNKDIAVKFSFLSFRI